jgi:hypothetical protein
MNNLTVSLDTAKKLKEAAWVKETALTWFKEKTNSANHYELGIIRTTADNPDIKFISEFEEGYYNKFFLKSCKTYPAPTLQEILEELPKEIVPKKDHHFCFEITMGMNGDVWEYIPNYNDTFFRETLFDLSCRHFNATEAVAKLYLKLKEHNLLTP